MRFVLTYDTAPSGLPDHVCDTRRLLLPPKNRSLLPSNLPPIPSRRINLLQNPLKRTPLLLNRLRRRKLPLPQNPMLPPKMVLPRRPRRKKRRRDLLGPPVTWLVACPHASAISSRRNPRRSMPPPRLTRLPQRLRSLLPSPLLRTPPQILPLRSLRNHRRRRPKRQTSLPRSLTLLLLLLLPLLKWPNAVVMSCYE